MVVTFASAIFATAIPSLVRIHDVDREVVTLGVSLYVLGFAFGPVIWASFSELKGRYLPFIISAFGFTAFSFGTAVSKGLTSILICRWFGGFFGAGPLTLAGPLYADMFVGKPFGVSMVVFAFTVFMGPIVAQPVGGFIVVNRDLGWQWTEYLCGILGAAALIPLVFTLKETYAPVILAKKAATIRDQSGDVSITSHFDEISLSLRVIIVDYVALPLKMLASDPIVLLMSLFGSFVYGLLYLFLVGYPVVFQKIHGMTPGVGGLPYLGLIVGELFAVMAIFLMQPWIMMKAKTNQGLMMPEWQLPIAVPGAVAFSVGLFWYGWTGYKQQIHWIVPTLSGLLTGFGLLATFVPSISYLVQARPER
jgi:DHA1 family multidrug resistance protein-like MFS transporter